MKSSYFKTVIEGKVWLSPSKKVVFIYFNESQIKMIKKASYNTHITQHLKK